MPDSNHKQNEAGPHATPDQQRAAQKRREAAELADNGPAAVQPAEAKPARKRTAKADD